MSLIEIKKYSLSFNIESNNYSVIDDVSLSINRNQMVAIVGESGCGKTMTAMSILRLLPKSARINSGEILFNGENVLNYSTAQMKEIRGSQIALIPQDPMTSLNPLYTIGNQLLEVINKDRLINDTDARKKAIEVLDIVKIPDAKNKLSSYPHEFSGGMKQRAIIAMALATNAKLIIADEPTTALDVTIQAEIMKILNEIKSNLDTSILLISHELNLVGEYSDNINVMYSGRIVETAPTSVFFNNPTHPYSKALLNSLPANNFNINRLKIINGQPPSIKDTINGCKFHPRCERFINNICNIKRPKLKEIEPRHFVECHLCDLN